MSSRRTLVACSLLLALTACAKTKKSDAPADASGASASTVSASGAAAGASAAGASTPSMSADVSPADMPIDTAKFFGSATPQKTAGGIEYVDTSEGQGPAIGTGDIAMFAFTGWLEDGKVFDASSKHQGDFCFAVGAAHNVPFFSEGLTGMKAGGTRRIKVPPEKGYGAMGRQPFIPPNATLYFEMRLREIRKASVMPDISKLTLKTTPSGLKWADLAVGPGEEVVKGSTPTVKYSGWLAKDGTKFDSNVDRCQTYDVANIGNANVIPGLNEGLIGMKVGGRRVLVVPPELAYGKEGRPPLVPMDATLAFDIEVTAVAPPIPPPEPMNFPDVKTLKLTKNPSGLQWTDLKVGTGKEVVAGGNVAVNYTGWLDNGTKFDSSLDSGQPYDVVGVGHAQVVAGWNEGLQGMKQGGRRVLVIPPDLGYGAQGYPGHIPPNSTLVFIVEASQVR
jgi:FKBP-type peptidyl-prolyl cis-trans isomerase